MGARATRLPLILGAIAFCASCNSQHVEPVQLPAPPGAVAGYIHDISRSQFKIGQNRRIEVDRPTLRRWRGSNGAWAVDPTNGWSMGILDASAPTGPYILDEADEGQRVKAYFVKAGIPADQVRDVRATFEIEGGGPLNDPKLQANVKLHSINSILRRSLQGVPVIESVAWAKMTTSGDVDMECVFWPAIDGNVVSRAVTFARQMSDRTAHDAYLAKLPGQVFQDGGVVIHHTDSSIHSVPTGYVSYDVTLSPEGYASMRHFDENGKEFRLPQEQVTARPSRPKPSPKARASTSNLSQ